MVVGVIIIYNTGGLHFRLPLPNVASEKDFSFISDPLVQQHFVMQSNVPAFRTITSSGEGESAISIVTEYERTKNGVNVRMAQRVGNEITSEAIFWGTDAYVNDPSDNTWWYQSITDEEKKQAGFAPKDFKAELIAKNGSVYEKQGEEACGALTCYKYVEAASGNALAKRTFWFDTKKFLLRRDDLSFGGLITTQLYEYDQIRINKPKQVKKTADAVSIIDYILAGGVSPQLETTASGSGLLNPDAVAEKLRADLRKQLQDQLQQELKNQLQQQLQDQLKQQLQDIPEGETPELPPADVMTTTPTP